MRAAALTRLAILGMTVVPAWNCANPIGASCLARQERGSVSSMSGTVAAGSVVALEVAYGTQGSQNDGSITWAGQHASGGARIHVYATLADCEDYRTCGRIGGMGGTLDPDARACAIAKTCQPEENDIVQTSFTVTNGRGNPERLGTPPRYKLWIVGDATRDVSYSINITYFYGPDC